MLRILQVGLGPLGLQVAREVEERGLGRIAAAVDTDPELAGRFLRELLPGADASARVHAELDAALDSAHFDAAFVLTSSWLADCAPTFGALLERGLAVVSTCEELLFPALRHAALAQQLDGIARAGGGRLVGTGINPGFVMDALPLFASGVCRELRAVHVLRRQDASTRRLGFQKKIGVGLAPEAFEEQWATGRFGHAGLEESLHFLAHHMGLELCTASMEVEPLLCEHDLESELGPVPAGAVRGVRQIARGETVCERRFELEFIAGLAVADPLDRVQISGDPDFRLEIPGGLHGDRTTTALTVNALHSLLAAPPGLHDAASLAPVRWRAAARLA